MRFPMFPFLAISTRSQAVPGRPRAFARPLLHKTTTLALAMGFGLFSQLAFTASLYAQSPDRPNFVLIYADDK